MKKGVFGSWFKELATLIFTQTVQAFLLAIVMTIIINALGGSDGSSNRNYAAGLLAIIALSQFGKIEMLVKNIFGVTSQFGDPAMANGKGGLLAGAMALRGLKKGLDNGGKFLSGNHEVKMAKNRLKELNNEKDLVEANSALGVAQNGEEDALQAMNSVAGETIDGMARGAELEAGRQIAGGDSGANYNNAGVGLPSSDVKQLIEAIKEQTKTIQSSGKSGGGALGNSKDQKSALDDQIDQAQLALKNAKNKRRSGIAESAADILGGSVGAIAGLAMGDNPIKTGLQGVAVADTVTAGAFNAVGNHNTRATEKRISERHVERSAERVDETKAKINIANNNKKVYENTIKNIEKTARKNKDNPEKAAYKIESMRARTINSAKKNNMNVNDL